MEFTIITPNLNYGSFLEECIESVKNQIGTSYQHIIIDGGSTDDSKEIASRYAHVEWIQELDQGMSDAINKGFARTRGDWVIWLNADDRLKPGILAKISPHLCKTNSDVIYGCWDFIDENGEYLRNVKVPNWSPFVHIHHHCFVGSTAAFYRKSTVIESGYRLRIDFHYVMDGEFYARLNHSGMIFERIPYNIADFRIHGSNQSQRHLGKSRDLDKILHAELQHVESRAIRRAYGITLFRDPYLNGLVDGILWLVAKAWKQVRKIL